MSFRDAQPFSEWRPWHCGISTIDQIEFECLGISMSLSHPVCLPTSDLMTHIIGEESYHEMMVLLHYVQDVSVIFWAVSRGLLCAGSKSKQSTSVGEKIKFNIGTLFA